MAKTTTTKRHHNDGLAKRCACARRRWTQCDHPWHFDFHFGRKYRFSLDKLAKARGEKPPRTKHAAEALADKVRSEIRSGVFADPTHPTAPAHDPAGLTVGAALDLYEARHVQAPGRRPGGVKTMQWLLALLRRTAIAAGQGQTVRFEEKRLASVTRGDIEAVRQARHADRPDTKGVGTNRLTSRARHFFAWCVLEGHLADSPFVKAGRSVIKLTPEAPRNRRLREGEEEALLAHAGPHLRDVIIACLSTGCRLGEVLGLRWRDIRVTTDARGVTHQTIMLSAAATKTNTQREIPVGQRLAAVLSLRQHAPDGQRLGPDAYVFGDACGGQVKSIKKAWMTCVLRANGHVPQWSRHQFTEASRRAYREVDLHLHDLRREFASRILESGSSLVEARDLLGHANVSQTSTYLQSTARSLGLAIERKEEHERLLAEARARGAVAPPEVSDATTTTAPGSDRVQ